MYTGLHTQHCSDAPDVQHPQHLCVDQPADPNRRGTPVVQCCYTAETGGSPHQNVLFHSNKLFSKKLVMLTVSLTPSLIVCAFPDSGAASSAGGAAFVGQDGALSGHEVPGGEVVQLLGKPT